MGIINGETTSVPDSAASTKPNSMYMSKAELRLARKEKQDREKL
jgi:hypothetical protein